MTSSTQTPVLIVGGGIGGLTAALCLLARGHEVTVLERAEALREVGAGLQISPNGLRVLDALGLGDRLRAVGLRGQAVVLRDFRAGAQVLRLDLSGQPEASAYHFLHRADLIDLLAEAARARGVSLRLGQAVAEVIPGTPARMTLRGGEALDARLILGADGVKSTVRPVLNGARDPDFTGQVAWRAVVPNAVDHPPEAWVHMGPGRHLVSYPLRGGRSVNLVAVEERSAWAAEGWNHVDDPANLRAAFGRFGGAARALIEAVEAPGLWGLFRHPVAPRWHGPGVAILGDAAHPTLPFLAQGANLALEDAWALAAAYDPDAADQGLARYQSWRRDRAAKVIAAANGNAWKYHLRNPVIRRAAHLGLRVADGLAPGRMLAQFDWLYGYDVTRLG